jgi:eukaryotic-like serine/threonine-protein kinase
MLTAGYELEELIGRGGMAVVFRARDVRLNRMVALKIVAPEHAADDSYKTRFISESRTAAAVDHPNIVPIYEAGEADGVLFIAMRFVQGGDVSSLVRGQPIASARAVDIIRQAASALDKAHARGLVHRDIKPENMLLDSGDDDRPDHLYLSDFGLSKEMLRASGPTPSGLFVGTMDYISPEQIEGRQLDGRADQYSLGCSAFKLLARLPPYPRDSGPAIIAAHLWAEPPLLSSLRPDLGEPVDQVFVKVLAKSPDDRYRTCTEFARALTEALTASPATAPPAGDSPPARRPAPDPAGEPASDPARLSGQLTMTAPGQPARPVPEPPPAHPPSRRILIGAAAGLVVIAAGLGLVHVLTGWPASAKPGPVATGPTPHKNSSNSLSSQNGSRVGKHENPASPSAPATTPAPDSSAQATVPAPVREFTQPGVPGVNAVAFSPDGTLATAGASGTTSLWNASDGTLIRTLSDRDSTDVLAIAFSPDGSLLATADSNGNVYLRDARTGALRRTLTDQGAGGVLAVAFSPDGKILATSDKAGRIALWNSASGTKLTTITIRASKGVNTLAFSPDGASLAAGDYNGTTYLRQMPSGAAVAQFPVPDAGSIDAVAFSPDGQTLATGSYDGTTYLWNVATEAITAQLTDFGTGTGVEAIAFSPDGQLLAAGDHDGSTYLWGLASQQVIKVLPTTPDTGLAKVWAIAFSPSGQLLATGDHSGSTDLWQVGP